MIVHFAPKNDPRIERGKEADRIYFGQGEEVGHVGSLYIRLYRDFIAGGIQDLHRHSARQQ